MKNFITTGLIFISILSCTPKTRYQKQLEIYDTFDSYLLNESLWSEAQYPWIENLSLQYIKELIKRGADVNYVNTSDVYHSTAFLNASGALECLRMRDIKTPAEIDSMEMEAIRIVKYLAEKGANIYATTSTHQTALHLAATGGREKMIPVLVELGLDINAKDSAIFGTHPLETAILAGHFPTVKAIVEAGADINAVSRYGNRPLDYAIRLANADSRNYNYHDQKEIYEYLKNLGAIHGKNDFKGSYF